MIAMTHAGLRRRGLGDRARHASAPTRSSRCAAAGALAAQVPPEERRWS